MNGDLISRRALLEEFGEEPYYWFKYDDAEIQQHNDWLYYTDCVKKAPAVDAVEVVRCKDCKWLYNGLDMYCCTKHTGLALITPDGSGFCSYGERRADDAD